MRWIGAILVIASCGGFGLLMTIQERKEERTLRQLSLALQWLGGELSFRMWPLPVLFRQVGERSSGILRDIFRDFARELDRTAEPDALGCMEGVLLRHPGLPQKAVEILSGLGASVGQLDLEGQLRQLLYWHTEAERALTEERNGREERHRCYRTLGFCAGLALALLLM